MKQALGLELDIFVVIVVCVTLKQTIFNCVAYKCRLVFQLYWG